MAEPALGLSSAGISCARQDQMSAHVRACARADPAAATTVPRAAKYRPRAHLMVPDLELDPVRAELEGNLAQD